MSLSTWTSIATYIIILILIDHLNNKKMSKNMDSQKRKRKEKNFERYNKVGGGSGCKVIYDGPYTMYMYVNVSTDRGAQRHMFL